MGRELFERVLSRHCSLDFSCDGVTGDYLDFDVQRSWEDWNTRHPTPTDKDDGWKERAVDVAMQKLVKHPVQSVREGVRIALDYALSAQPPQAESK